MAVKFPESTKTSVHQRLLARARQRWPQIAQLRVRHRGSFTYLEATTTEEATLPLCRLRYVGSAHHWQVAIYRASHNDYAESIFPTGLPIGTSGTIRKPSIRPLPDDPLWRHSRPGSAMLRVHRHLGASRR